MNFVPLKRIGLSCLQAHYLSCLFYFPFLIQSSTTLALVTMAFLPPSQESESLESDTPGPIPPLSLLSTTEPSVSSAMQVKLLYETIILSGVYGLLSIFALFVFVWLRRVFAAAHCFTLREMTAMLCVGFGALRCVCFVLGYNDPTWTAVAFVDDIPGFAFFVLVALIVLQWINASNRSVEDKQAYLAARTVVGVAIFVASLGFLLLLYFYPQIHGSGSNLDKETRHTMNILDNSFYDICYAFLGMLICMFIIIRRQYFRGFYSWDAMYSRKMLAFLIITVLGFAVRVGLSLFFSLYYYKTANISAREVGGLSASELLIYYIAGEALPAVMLMCVLWQLIFHGDNARRGWPDDNSAAFYYTGVDSLTQTSNTASGGSITPTPYWTASEPRTIQGSTAKSYGSVQSSDYTPISTSYGSPPPISSLRNSIFANAEARANSSSVGVREIHLPRIEYRQLIVEDSPFASGSEGELYKAIWNRKIVALKRLRFSSVLSDEEVKDCIRELKILVKAQHQNIVKFYGLVLNDRLSDLAYVMEFMERGSLQRVLQSGVHLSYLARLRIARDVARGMAYLHSLQPPIVHRDLKSSNLLLDMDFNCKICDFGISAIKDKTMKTMTGTLEYMAPEVLRGDGDYDEKVDSYSFGVVMTELFSGNQPYSKLQEDLRTIQYKARISNVQVRPELPSLEFCTKSVQVLIKECLQEKPSDRPSFDVILPRIELEVEDEKDRIAQAEFALARNVDKPSMLEE